MEIALIWTAVTALFPLIENSSEAVNWTILPGRFFFFSAVALPFDIRDMNIDRNENLRTLPLTVGWERSKWFSYVALLCFVLCTCVEFLLDVVSGFQLTAYGLSALLTAICINRARPNGSLLYYGLALDGSNLLQGVFSWMAFIAEYGFSTG